MADPVTTDPLETGTRQAAAFQRLDTELLVAAATALADQATSSVNVTIPSDRRGLSEFGPALHAMAKTVRPDVEFRVLFPSRAFDGEVLRRLTTERANVAVRIAESPLQGVVMADFRSALLWSPIALKGGSVALFDKSAEIGALGSLFLGAWGSAIPLTEFLKRRELVRHEDQRQVLGHLRDGHTDRVAAQKMGISYRTYRRRVAEILEGLGAESRFQAGVRASELGLLSPLEDAQ
ncbi:hypothetical protein JK364_31500 [Streptomyces sp. 110]|uniref:HTH luxR-type domain-containing protein n=1 Tax=Streptomyces endocoffeicus TaxID=2898945 RepID=A0ABS1PXN6_9ACTN|nr:hypothetical protein [Streptomyces endocoffeicus]MBL1116880.1 hypothetical protein [Streptomyces endocoffeicus]